MDPQAQQPASFFAMVTDKRNAQKRKCVVTAVHQESGFTDLLILVCTFAAFDDGCAFDDDPNSGERARLACWRWCPRQRELLRSFSAEITKASRFFAIRNLTSNIEHQTSEVMNIETLHIGMKVRHPQYGVGVVKSLAGQTAEIAFDDAQRTIAPASSDLQPAEPTATLSELQMPLAKLIRDTAHALVEALGLEQQDMLVEGLATRWQRGTLVMQSADSSLQPKEVPLETFFHKIVMIRNNLRVLEQKVNASDKLSEADKFDLQQYITRCYGSLTTFNILFKNKDDQFRTGGT
jgi:hypothetical protein